MQFIFKVRSGRKWTTDIHCVLKDLSIKEKWFLFSASRSRNSMCRTTIPAVRVSCSYGARRRHRRPTDHDVPICVTTAGTTTSHCTCEAGRPPRCMAPPLCRAGRRSRRNNLQHTPSAAAVDRRDRQTERQTGRETGRPTDGPPRCTAVSLCHAGRRSNLQHKPSAAVD